jgi:peroxiredoxin
MKNSPLILLICFQVTLIDNLSARANTKPCGKAKFYTDSPARNPYNITRNDSLAMNSPAPEFSLYDLKGKRYSLKDLKGKIVVLNFWFIACKPCVNEMHVLNAIKNSFDPEKVVFLALSLDHKNAIEAFLKNYRFEYTILPDAKGVAEKYDLNAYPASIVIDSNGIIRFMQIGGPNIGQDLIAAITAILRKWSKGKVVTVTCSQW